MELIKLTPEEVETLAAGLLKANAETCGVCRHCDLTEATEQSPGFCTKAGNPFNGKSVTYWMRGCPNWEEM